MCQCMQRIPLGHNLYKTHTCITICMGHFIEQGITVTKLSLNLPLTLTMVTKGNIWALLVFQMKAVFNVNDFSIWKGVKKKKIVNVGVLLGFLVIAWTSGSHKMTSAEYRQIHAHRKRVRRLLRTEDIHRE